MTDPKKAAFRIKGSSKPIEVHFNPSTLQLTLTTKLGQSKDKKKGGRQVVNEGSAKLAVDLIFDTTNTLENVCDQTVKVARLLGEKNETPPQVTFDWGAFQFTGLVDSYKETLEFFSADGVPLRSTVSLTMTQDEDIFSRGKEGQKAAGWSAGQGNEGGDGAAQVTAPPPGESLTKTATQAGAPAAGRAIAAQNGEESMRFPRSPTLTVNASVTLSPPVAFTTGQLSLGASAGLGLSAGVGGASAGASLSFGGSASAGISVSQGAFAGLRVSSTVPAASLQLDTRRLHHREEALSYAADEGATFDLGGRLKTQGPRLGGTARARIRFEEE